jgi:hypothetical protein
MRSWTRVGLTAVAIGALLAGCGSKGDNTGAPPGGAGTLGGAPKTTAATTPSAKPRQTTKAAAPPLNCDELKNAAVGSPSISYNGYLDSIPLAAGHWSGEDGNNVDLQAPCGIGDLDADGSADAVGVVELTNGGTGQFYTLVVWRNVDGQPVCVAVTDLGDRNPVESISIAGGKATVVYDTRTSDAPMAVVNIRRTATYKLTGPVFDEVNHSDAPISS